MLEFFAILSLLFAAPGDVEMSANAAASSVETQSNVQIGSGVVIGSNVEIGSDDVKVEVSEAPAVTLPDPFPEFSAALTHCLDYFENGDITVFEDGTETLEGVGTLSVFYPSQSNPPPFQIIVTQQGAAFNCGGTGAAAPRSSDIDTRAVLKLREIFAAHDMVEVKFPEPTRVWANCNTTGDRFVMLVPGAGDLIVLSASGNEPTAGVYCQAFGVKE